MNAWPFHPQFIRHPWIARSSRASFGANLRVSGGGGISMAILRRQRLAALGLLTMWLAAGRAPAQEANATITGTVADEQGQVLPGATVTLINEATKLARTAVADG